MALKMTTTNSGSSNKWKIEFTQTAEKQFEKLDKSMRQTINRYISERLATEEDPRRFGKALSGNMKEFWRYRLGDYRMICEIQDKKLLILVVRLAHRSHVYD